MYSYEDRIQAVELYIKLGQRVRPTIRQLSYPTKNALKGWYWEYEQGLDLPAGYAGRPPKYSQVQKEAAVEHYLTHDRCIAATMRALGCPGRGRLTAWVREALPESRKAVVGSVGRPKYPESMKQAGVVEQSRVSHQFLRLRPSGNQFCLPLRNRCPILKLAPTSCSIACQLS